MMEYTHYIDSCMEELNSLQEGFMAKYNIGAYANWFYNQSTGLLTFSTGDQELNFSYVDIGSFSVKGQSWNWSWDNPSAIKSVKEGVEMIRQFGTQNGFEKLTTGYFASDEYEAWGFAAIALRLIGGIGVYRPVNDRQLQLFFVVKALVDNETAKKIKSRFIACSDHNYARLAIVCRHLNRTSKVGFVEAFETWEDMELDEEEECQAWCSACEEIRLAEGEWNDTSMAFAQITAVCEQCYFEMKELNLGYR